MKKVEEMTVGEIIETEVFEKKVSDCLIELRSAYRKAVVKGLQLKRNPFDRLMERGVANPKAFAALYVLVLTKKLEGYSSSERKLIKEVGDEALHRAHSILTIEQNSKENEKNN